MMNIVIKAIFMSAITMAIIVSLSTNRVGEETEGNHVNSKDQERQTNHTQEATVQSQKRVSRFLAATTNPRAASHCHKDNEVCYSGEFGNRTTCCNNKCVDLQFDDKNCGACKKKCKYTQNCCRGECVYLSLDKRHCGQCNNRCPYGNYCIYGMCEYP